MQWCFEECKHWKASLFLTWAQGTKFINIKKDGKINKEHAIKYCKLEEKRKTLLLVLPESIVKYNKSYINCHSA